MVDALSRISNLEFEISLRNPGAPGTLFKLWIQKHFEVIAAHFRGLDQF
jgi:hypothetical protein